MINDRLLDSLWFVVPAAGISQRMIASCPKQYLPLLGSTIIETTLNTLLSLDMVVGIVVALHAEDKYWPQLPIAKHKKIHTVIGGYNRCDSVLVALNYLATSISHSNWVLVHDAARPCVDLKSIHSLINKLSTHQIGGILGVRSSDTLKQVNDCHLIESTLNRDHIWQAQTPQMFRYGILRDSLLQAISSDKIVTDEASAVEAMGHQINVVQGRSDNIKITYLNDLWLAEAILQHRSDINHRNISYDSIS